MMRLRLNEQEVEVAHLYGCLTGPGVSAEEIEALEADLKQAVKDAVAGYCLVVVERDCVDHLFVVFPSANICLFRRVGSYRIVRGS